MRGKTLQDLIREVQFGFHLVKSFLHKLAAHSLKFDWEILTATEESTICALTRLLEISMHGEMQERLSLPRSGKI